MTEDVQHAGRGAAVRRLAAGAFAFGRLLLGQFAKHRGAEHAAALSYTTLLSLVPLMTVVLAIFSAFPIADQLSLLVQEFLFANFVPASGAVLRQQLQAFSAKAAQLTGAGSLFLVLVALLLMRRIDHALNAIWEVRRQRGPVGRFVLYWAILSLGPLLIGASLIATSYLVSLPLVSDAVATGFGRQLLALTPVAASTLAFTLVYALVPNRHVPMRHALMGGVLAGVLFELAKGVFGWYLTTFPTYQAIYGVLASIPLFLVWLYLSWTVVLLGAEFTCCLDIFRRQDGLTAARRLGLADAVRLLSLLGEGQSWTLQRLAAVEPRWSQRHLDDLLYELRGLGLVYRTDQGNWVLGRSLDQVTLNDLARAARFRLPRAGDPDWPEDPELAKVLGAAGAGLATALQVPLARFRHPRPGAVATKRSRA